MTAATPSIGDSRPSPLPSPEDSLVPARIVLDTPKALAGPGWSRSVVLLLRQALEDAVARFWIQRAPGMEQATRKSQFVALRLYVDDPATARREHHVWATLSDAAHHNTYDLAPTAAELRGWLDDVTDLVDRMARSGGAPPAARHAVQT
jgi:hypothetical protein